VKRFLFSFLKCREENLLYLKKYTFALIKKKADNKKKEIVA